MLRYIATNKKADWNFTMHDIERFAKDTGLLMRALCRFCSQAMRRGGSRPSWTKHLDEKIGSDGDDTDKNESGEYFVGYNRDKRHAFRCAADDPDKTEITREFHVQPGSADSDPVWAKWPDGFEHPIVAVTAGRFHKIFDEKNYQA